MRPVYILSYYGVLNGSVLRDTEPNEHTELNNFDCRVMLPNGQRYRIITQACNPQPWRQNDTAPECTIHKVGHWRGIDTESVTELGEGCFTFGQGLRKVMEVEGLQYDDSTQLVWSHQTHWPTWWDNIRRTSESDYQFYRRIARDTLVEQRTKHRETWLAYSRRMGVSPTNEEEF